MYTCYTNGGCCLIRDPNNGHRDGGTGVAVNQRELVAALPEVVGARADHHRPADDGLRGPVVKSQYSETFTLNID